MHGLRVFPFLCLKLTSWMELPLDWTHSGKVGYQTNLMVYGPGGYKFTVYVKIGVPLTIVVGIITIILTPIFFRFQAS